MRVKFAFITVILMILVQTTSAKPEPLLFSDIPGWESDDFAKAWRVFYDSCADIQKRKDTFKSIREQDLALTAVCSDAARLPAKLSKSEARRFFETHFEPVKLTPAERGMMTGYYEPEFRASTKQTAEFSVPVLRRPNDLVSEVAPPGYPNLKAARKMPPDGALVPYPDRAEIENGALKDQHLEIFWMRPFDLFTMQVQGSGRLKLKDGETVYLAYDGKNGQPYTSIGKVLLDRGTLQKGNVTMQAIGAAFKADPRLAHEVMQQNKSYVFFRVLKDRDPKLGPVGAQSLALTPLRSIAIDRELYTYGLPFFIDGALPQGGNKKPFRHLAIAQDTGTAIKGQSRLDLFIGSGKQAEEIAGRLQERVNVYLLRPKKLP
jgi:membrane-bound lytic murein transglycosylase A